MAELKLCPFCGGEAIADYAIMGYNSWGVICLKCGAYIDTLFCEDDTKEQAIENWNRRGE